MSISLSPAKARIFIGSSAEQAEAANEVQEIFSHNFRADIWLAGTFRSGHRPLDDLEEKATKSDYGIFVFGPDDRLFSREAEYSATRDNVIFELGLFMGKLGIDKCFVIAPKEIEDLRIPSDLDGYSIEKYDLEHAKENFPGALNPCCTRIKRAIQEATRERMGAGQQPSPKSVTSKSDESLRRIRDIVNQLAIGRAGMDISVRSEDDLREWAEKVALANAQHLLKQCGDVPADASFVWLRPVSTSGPQVLDVFASINLPEQKHYRFNLGEGLAGAVWKDGLARIHSPSHPFEGWEIRSGCENQTYVCVGIGEPSGDGGVLGAGSDSGFEPSEKQFEMMQTVASLLGITAAGVKP